MYRKLFQATALLALTAPAFAQADNWTRIQTEEQFREIIVDRKSANENGWVTVKSNGRMTGNIKGQGKLVGRWAWGNGFFCRNAMVGKTDLGQNCQTVHVAGNKVRFSRDQGKGQQSIWQLE